MAETQRNEHLNETVPLLLLEIGTEEIPARFMPDAIVSLKDNAERLFSEYRLPYSSVKTYATPRRLSLIAEIHPSQKELEKEVWGPPVTVAFDDAGNPTKAAEAFAKTHGLPVEALKRKEKGKGTYLVAPVREGARESGELLPELLPKLILSLIFPKSMRWGDGNLRFVRPIQWIYALYNNEKIRFEIDGIRSGTITRGHRFLSPGAFEIRDVKAYINLLRNNFVVLDPEERRRTIIEGAKKLASSVGASLVEDEDLLQHVTYLVEYPVPVLGSFPADYLSLPRELLITVMKDHQKYFALEGVDSNLTNYFVVVSNTKYDNAETIRRGAERVIKARFEDARFYYAEDRKLPLKQRLEGLKRVIYHDRLGSLYDKTERLAALADFIVDRSCPEKKEGAHIAALLAKADLISGVVREFPELQGIMGSYYALHEGYDEEISKALSEHYLPAHSGDKLPQSDLGAIVSLADKLDNIASSFMLGQKPTGNEDPFALRRQALGTIGILIDKGYPVTISELLGKALEPFALSNREETLNDIVRFFEQRIEPLFLAGGYSLDTILAALNFVSNAPLIAFKGRIDALKKFREAPGYETFLLAIKRVNNIAAKGEGSQVARDLLQQDEEKDLHSQAENVAPLLNSLLGKSNYYEAIRVLLRLTEPINRFFDKVLVMDKREEIKENRLSLIKMIQLLAQQIADFSKLS